MILIYTQYGSALFSIIKKIVILLLDHIKLVHSIYIQVIKQQVGQTKCALHNPQIYMHK